MLLHGISNVCFQILQDTEWPLFKNSTESWNDSYCACNLKRQVMNWVLYRDTWHWRKKEAMLNHKKLKIKIYFEVLCNCGKRLLRTIRTRRSKSTWLMAIHWLPNPTMQRIFLPCNGHKPPRNWAIQYHRFQRWPGYLLASS